MGYIVAIVSGIFLGSAFSILPGLHIYNVIAISMTLMLGAAKLFSGVEPLIVASFLISMTVTFSLLFTISTQYFQPCDDSFKYIVLPHEKYYFEGRAHEAVILGGIGGLVAILLISFIYPLMGPVFVFFTNLLRPHLFWLIGIVMVFILLTEWPKDHGVGKTLWQRFFDGWLPLCMGYLTFALAGLLGMFIFYRTITPVGNAFQTLMPVFVGLFAIPSYILTFITRVKPQPQYFGPSVDVSVADVIRGSISGTFAGLFAGFVPAVTPGPALLLTGHLTVTGGDKQFMIAGGACRVIYYIGSLMMFFIPDVYLRRGGLAINLSLFYVPETKREYLFITAVVCIAGLISFLLLFHFSKLCATLSQKVHYKWFSLIGLIALSALVFVVTGVNGLFLMAVATCIGIVPNLWHTRRINLLAVLLVPMFLNLSGVGPEVAHWLGLI
jgi:putative membrane protein